MRKYTFVFFLPLFATFLPAASFTNGQAARAVLGQQEFTFGAALSSGTEPYLLGGPSGLAYANGLLFVADSNVVGASAVDQASVEANNNRVLVFNTTQIPPPDADLTQYTAFSPYCGLCGYSAVNVLGEPDFVSQGPQAVSSQSLNAPTAVATDGHILAVADTNNNRVLIWNSIPSAIDQAANVVLGSSSFTTPGSPAATQTNFRGPQGIWIQNGKLFVADTQNYRVLIWNSIPTSNNQPADLVLGQSNFTSGTQPACNPTNSTYTAAANEFCNPVSVTSDGTHLFVADLAFNRVLIWNSIPTSNNQPADVVVGQPDMVSAVPDNPAVCNGAAECAASLNYPRYALSDGTRLFIADGGDDRVLIFNSIPTSNGASADTVLGQPDFVSDADTSANTTESIVSTAIDNTGSVDTVPSPMSLAWDGTNLYVSDPFNRRVLVFTPGDSSLPDNSVVNWASQIIRQEGAVLVSLPTGGSITANDTVTISIGLASAASPTAYAYTIKSGDTLDGIAQALVNLINANSGDPNATAIFGGTGTGTVFLVSKGIDLGYDTISLSATTSNTADIIATASGAYLTAGTAATGAPGMLVLISGTNLSDVPHGFPVVASLTQTLPTTLGGAQVFMDGIVTPLLSVSANQIVTQIPYSFTNESGSTSNTTPVTATDRNSTSIYVRTVHNDGSITITNATPMYIAPANPGLFNTSPGQLLAPVSGALHQSGNATAVVSIDGSVTAGNTATITVNGRNYQYTVVSTDSLTSIAQSLVNLINNAPDPQVTASLGNAFSRVVLTAIQPGAGGVNIPISGSTSSGATVTVTPYTTSTCCDVVPGSAITPANPAGPGELITVPAAGLGLLANGVTATEGQPYNGTTANTASNEVVATISGTSAQVISAGLPQGAIGTYQIQLIVPTGLSASSNAQLYVAENAFISNIVALPIGTPVPLEANTSPPPSSDPVVANIDSPSPQGGPYSGTAHFAGWAIDQNASMSGVNTFIDGVFYGAAAYGDTSRPDVCANYSSAPNCTSSNNVGWDILVDTTRFADGAHTFQITATGSDGMNRTISVAFTTANASPNNPTHIFADLPNASSLPLQGTTLFYGWAVNDNAAISSVTVSIDGASLGTAAYGDFRPDVCAAYPNRAGCPNVGWAILVDTNKFPNGTHTLTVAATATNGQYWEVSTAFNIANWSTANPTIIDIDSPSVQAGPFSGSVGFGGWAIDNNVAIASVSIDIDGVSYGNAAYGGTRTDVCNVYPNRPGCPDVGWNFGFDSTLIGDGTHTLSVTATTVTGQSSTVTRTFSVANLVGSNPLKAFIDVPGPSSGAFSGTGSFYGWALSTDAHMSSVQILIDGVARGTGTPTDRPDVCMVYPSSPDCPNVGWMFTFDTTLLSNGAHTLEVTGTSASGERGTVSALFTVANTTASSPTQAYIDQPGPDSDPFEGLAQFYGWAINTSNATITSVAISVDGVPNGNATYGASRPDVCNVFGNLAGCPNVGWSLLLDTTILPDGIHTLGVTAYASDGTHTTATSRFRIANWTVPSSILIDIDTPAIAAASYSGTVDFGGWALDEDGPIASVSVAIDGVPYSGAVYGGGRPDVCNAYPGFAGCPNVGYDFSFDTTLITNGNHTIAVTAISSTGQSTTTTRSFTVSN